MHRFVSVNRPGRPSKYFGAIMIAGLSCLPISAKADDFPVVSVMRTPVKVDVKDASSDEHLLQIARAADVNVFADVTSEDANAPKVTLQTNYPLEGTFLHFNDTHNTRLLRFGARNFLLWKEPQTDEVALARQVLAQSERERAELPPDLTKPLERKRRLAEYFQQEHGWNGNWETADVSVRVANLPPDLRLLVLHYIHEQTGGRYSENGRRFDDRILRSGRFIIGSDAGRAPGTRVPQLRVAINLPELEMHQQWGVGPLNQVRR